jgi:hypothetical protein
MVISLDEDVAAELREQANACQLPADKLAQQLLGDALQQLRFEKQWKQKNHRRVSLIRKSSAEGLTPEEEAELDDLQLEADRRLAPMDQRLFAGLQPLVEAVERLRQETAGKQ